MPDTVVNTKKTEMKKALPHQELPVFMMFCKLGTCGSERWRDLYKIYTREGKSGSLEPKCLLPGLLPASFDDCVSEALSTWVLLPLPSQNYSDVLGSREKNVWGWRARRRGAFSSLFHQGRDFLPEEILCIALDPEVGRGGSPISALDSLCDFRQIT